MIKEKYKPMIKMTKYILIDKKEFIISVIYGILNSMFSLLTVLMGAYITSAAFFKAEAAKILYLFIPLIIFISGKGIFAFLEMYECYLVAYGVIEKIRNLLYDAVSATTPQSTVKKRTGNITSAFVEDVESMEVFYAHTAGAYIIAFVYHFISFCFSVSFRKNCKRCFCIVYFNCNCSVFF